VANLIARGNARHNCAFGGVTSCHLERQHHQLRPIDEESCGSRDWQQESYWTVDQGRILRSSASLGSRIRNGLRTTPAEASGCAASYRSEDTKTTSTRARPVRACLRRTTSAPVISGSLIFGTADRAATRPPRSTLRRAIPSSYLTPAFGGENQASAQRSRLVFNQQNARWVIVVVQPDSFQPRPTDTAIVKWSVPTVRSGQSCGEGGGVHRLIGRASDDQGRMTASKSSSLATHSSRNVTEIHVLR
jgi:hypothetical protein